MRQKKIIVQRVRLSKICTVVEISGVERIVLRERLVNSCGVEVFRRNCLVDKGVNCRVPVPKKGTVGCRIEAQIFRRIRRERDGDRETGDGGMGVPSTRSEGC